MSNITLKTFASTNGAKYPLNQDNYSKMINDSQISLNLIENNSDKSKYQKEYVILKKPSKFLICILRGEFALQIRLSSLCN